MSEPKEPSFFSNDDKYALGLDWYKSLFDKAGPGDLLGESSTNYTKLPTHSNCVTRIAKHLPGAKLIYVMRHPVERLISHYMHDWTTREVGYFDSLDLANHSRDEFVAYGRYNFQLEPYLEQFGTEAVLPVFFPRLKTSPQVELERICRFIGFDGQPVWRSDIGPQNISQERNRKFPFYRTLIDSDWATILRRGLIPKSMRRRVRAFFQLRQRPELSKESRAVVEAALDRDLAALGKKLGIVLNCANFDEVTASRALEWGGTGEL